MSTFSLNAISPIDGRYQNKVSQLSEYFSEHGLIKNRVIVEIEYFISLCEIPLPQLENFDNTGFNKLRSIYKNFTFEDSIKIKEIEKETSRNKRLILNVALNYGGRLDIVNSVNSFYENKKIIKKITEKNINSGLYTKGQFDVDLLIRTGGQQRMSNFLLWQSAYAELYFSKKLWPDFDEKVFVNALYFFQNTERKFGSI